MNEVTKTLKAIHALRMIQGNFSEQGIYNSNLIHILEISLRATNASANLRIKNMGRYQ